MVEPTIDDVVQREKESFPSVDYYSDNFAGETARSAKYEKSMRVLSTDLSKDVDSISGIRWTDGLSDIPIKQSLIIVRGTVNDVKANLSTNKSTVYTTIRIRIGDVFKNASRRELGAYLEAEREGGIVVYPSGFKFWHRLAGQKMPTVAREYVFFLTNEFPLIGIAKDDLYLITAVELSKSGVALLDNPGEKHAFFSRYKNQTTSEFIESLRTTMK